MLDILIGVGLLGSSFTTGFLVCHLSKKYRAKVMVYFHGKTTQGFSQQERLEKICDTWLNLRTMFYSWRAELSSAKYFSTVVLMSELDELLSISEREDELIKLKSKLKNLNTRTAIAD